MLRVSKSCFPNQPLEYMHSTSPRPYVFFAIEPFEQYCTIRGDINLFNRLADKRTNEQIQFLTKILNQKIAMGWPFVHSFATKMVLGTIWQSQHPLSWKRWAMRLFHCRVLTSIYLLFYACQELKSPRCGLVYRFFRVSKPICDSL